jgi:hypothetical protein
LELGCCMHNPSQIVAFTFLWLSSWWPPTCHFPKSVHISILCSHSSLMSWADQCD